MIIDRLGVKPFAVRLLGRLQFLTGCICGVLLLPLRDMTPEDRLKLEEKVVEALRTVYDPEIPVDIYSLGLIYKIDIDDDGNLSVDMTMTAPSCPMADFIMEDVRQKLEAVEGLKSVQVQLVFEPEWTQDMMSEEAKLELGFL